MSQNALNNQTYDADFIANRQAASAGTTCFIAAVHNDAVNAGSSAQVVAQSQAASGADAYHVSALASTRAWCHGIDASDAGALKETTFAGGSTSPSTGTLTRKVFTTGEQIMPLQPAFFGYLSADDLNVTGAGTQFYIGSGNAFIITSQQGSNFTTGGVFTAPVSGVYHFDACVCIDDITLAMDTIDVYFQISAGPSNIYGINANPNNLINGALGGIGIINISRSFFLVAGSAVRLAVLISNGAGDTADIRGGTGIGPGGSTSIFTSFSGYLVC